MSLAVDALVITGAGAETISVSVVVPVPEPLVALRVIVDEPDAIGVPEISPLEVLTDRPEGSSVAPKLVGELVALIW